MRVVLPKCLLCTASPCLNIAINIINIISIISIISIINIINIIGSPLRITQILAAPGHISITISTFIVRCNWLPLLNSMLFFYKKKSSFPHFWIKKQNLKQMQKFVLNQIGNGLYYRTKNNLFNVEIRVPRYRGDRGLEWVCLRRCEWVLVERRCKAKREEFRAP